MRSNSEWILRNIFGEPYDASGIGDGPLALQILLSQNSPNPFGGTTRIAFSLSKAAEVRLGIYDVRGREVTELVDQRMAAGKHSVEWGGVNRGGRRVASGVYWCLLQSGDRAFTRKMVVLE